MNNKRGVVLVLFLILLPVICVLFVVLFDGLNMKYVKNNVEGVLQDVLDNPYEIERILKLNDIKYKEYNFYQEDGKRCVSLEMEKESIFGFILDKELFEIKAIACRN